MISLNTVSPKIYILYFYMDNLEYLIDSIKNGEIACIFSILLTIIDIYVHT